MSYGKVHTAIHTYLRGEGEIREVPVNLHYAAVVLLYNGRPALNKMTWTASKKRFLNSQY